MCYALGALSDGCKDLFSSHSPLKLFKSIVVLGVARNNRAGGYGWHVWARAEFHQLEFGISGGLRVCYE